MSAVPAATPVGAAPAATPPPLATPPAVPPAASPPVLPPAATPPVVPPVTPPVAPPLTPPVAAPPPILTPPAPPPVITPPVAAPVATPPPVVSPPPPPVLSPPAAAPVATPPALPPTATPPGASPPPPGTSPPPPSPSPPPPFPPPPSPPPPSPPPNGPPPPPGTPASPPPPPTSPPPPSPVAPPPPARSPPRPPPPPVNGTLAGGGGGKSSGLGTTTIVGIAVGGVVALVLVAVVWVCIARKKPKQKLNYAHRVGHAAAAGGAPGGSAVSDGYSSYGSRTDYLDSGEIKPPPPPPGLSGSLGAAGLGAAAGAGGLAAAAAGGKKPVPPPPQANNSAGSTRPWFTYEELEEATNGFSPANVLGEGGFGRVYKGTIAGNQLVAVKQLTIGGGQGEREFRAEVEIISRVHHRHLVSLVGYCIADSQRLLVYDFVPNGTLEHALHGAGRPVMEWATRVKIALGSARGLAYLHEDCHPRIIHRDIKASNILLDNQWEAQVADFGLAKLANDTHTHVTTRVMGTFGYLAPEYALSGKLTDKSDVYSFGVVLLELITGKKPVDVSAAAGEESLVEWARPVLTQALESGNVDNLADPNLMDMYNEKEMLRMVEVAAACVRHSSQKRPKMAMVVRALETEGADLNQGSKPGYSTVYGTGESSEFDSSQYKANLRKFRNMAYGTSTSQYSSDYSANTSDYAAGAQSASSSEFGSSSREHPTAAPVRGPTAMDSTSSGERSADDVRLDIGDEQSSRGTGTGVSPRGAGGNGVGLSKMGPTPGTLPLPPNRRPMGATGLSVRSPRGGESVRSRSPAGKTGHQRRGSESGTGGGPGIVQRLGSFASSVFSHDSEAKPPPPPPEYSGEFPESKYSTEDEGLRKPIRADRLEEGSRPLLSTHKTKTVKFDFDG